MRASLQAKGDRASIAYADEADIASMRLQVRARLFEGLLHTGFEGVGVKSIEQEKAADKRVLSESVDYAVLTWRILMHDFQHSFDACAVKLH